jgi:Tfp pilus assembly protein PilN
MTGHEIEAPTTASAVDQGVRPAEIRNAAVLPFWRRALAFGTGFGIAIGERHLEAAIVRARPAGPALIASTAIHDFRNRPAAEWGAELLKFVDAAGGKGLAATVLLPRTEVIVRTLNLPGVADKDAANAIELQADTLHPWGDVEIAWGWSRAGHGALKDTVIVGVTRMELLGFYETLFQEAGIPLAAATFSPAVIHAALRIWSEAPGSLLCFHTDGNQRTEIYGESESRAVFSAEFSMPRERALALARAELRMAPDYAARPLSEVLPGAPLDGALSDVDLAYTAAMAGSAPRAARFANLLPPARRASHDRVQYLVPAILGTLLALALLTVFVVFPAVEQKRYRADLEQAARRLEPAVMRAQGIERKIKENRSRTQMLDEIRRRPQADLEVLNELTRLLPPPVWTTSIEIFPDTVVISGEADQAAPLLKVLDSSPLFQNSEFALALTRTSQTEQFRIKTTRRGRAGRTAP